MSAPFHVNYYLASKSETADRIANIKDYYYMQGVRALVRPVGLDNDEERVLLVTYLHNVVVDAELLSSSFREG